MRSPHVAVIDRGHCLHWQEAACTVCRESCPFGSIDYEATEEIREIKVGGMVVATGFDLFDLSRAPQYGYETIENVVTSLQFERMLSATGPTQGKIKLSSGETPSRIAMIHCVGSRSKEFDEHCSGICCSYLLKFTRQCLERLPEASVEMLYADWCLPGKASQGFFNVLPVSRECPFHVCGRPNDLRIVKEDGAIRIDYTDAIGRPTSAYCDMVVLAPAMEGARDSEEIANLLELARGKGAFFEEEDVTIAPIASNRSGIYVAGCARGPKDIQSSVAEGQAAAGQLLAGLDIRGRSSPFRPWLPRPTSTSAPGAGLAPRSAPMGRSTTMKAGITPLSMKSSVAAAGFAQPPVPGGAITTSHYTDTQLSAEIKGLVSKERLDDPRMNSDAKSLALIILHG